jgi:hypothetical protein
LEEPDTRAFAVQNPRAFLSQHKQGMIIDEAQRAPELVSCMQTMSDAAKKIVILS